MIRALTFNGVSTEDLGVWVTAADYGKLRARIVKEKIAYRNGSLNMSRTDGNLYFEECTIKYTFAIEADTPEQLEDKLSALESWLYSNGSNELSDGYKAGWLYTDVQCETTETKYLNDQRTQAKLIAELTAYPLMLKSGGDERRL